MKKHFRQILSVLLALVMVVGMIPPNSLLLSANAAQGVASTYAVGDMISFGSYPQKDVTASMGSTLNAMAPSVDSWNSYRYYTGNNYSGSNGFAKMTPSDYMRYYDMTVDGRMYRGVYFSDYRPRATGYDHSAEYSQQDDNGYNPGTYWFLWEPLRWKVLNPSSGMIMCSSLIDAQAFTNFVYPGSSHYYTDTSKEHYANDYAYSSVREWLNGYFLRQRFPRIRERLSKGQRWITAIQVPSYTPVRTQRTWCFCFLAMR